MTSSSPEVAATSGTVVIDAQSADHHGTAVRPWSFAHRELRSGEWTRLGGEAVLGDEVTEHVLSTLAADAQAAASARGYATGWAEGRRAAEQEARAAELAAAEQRRLEEQRREAEHRAAVRALLDAAAALEDATAQTCTAVQTHAVRLAAQLTEALVGHELAAAKSPGLGAVRRALALMPGEPVARIRVSLEEAADPELAALAGAAVVVADPTLSRGDAVVETDTGVVDASVSGALQRVLEVLT